MLADQVVSVIPTPKVSHDATLSSPGEVCLETLNRSFTTAERKELKMLDVQEKPELAFEEPKPSVAEKRTAIETALRENPQRSDREIARIVDVDHKTVAARRRAMGIASPLGNSPPTPTEHRQMLINAGKDFDAKYPQETAEEVVDPMLAEGKLNYATAGSGGAGTPVVPKEPEFDPFAQDCEDLVIPHQPAIAVYENPFGAVIIRQSCTMGDNDDPIIVVRPEHVEKLVARLRQVAKETLARCVISSRPQVSAPR
jgi:hypothetical protein